MADFRFLSVESPTDTLLVEFSPEVRLLFHYLSLVADDFGFLVDDPLKIERELFPGQKGLVSIEADLDLLVAAGRLERLIAYQKSSPRRIIHILNWANHQSRNTYSKPTFGDPSVIAEISRDANGKTLTHKRESFANLVSERVIPQYVKVPVPTLRQRFEAGETAGASRTKSAKASCDECGMVTGSIRFIAPFIGDQLSGWMGTYVTEGGIEIVPSKSGRVAILCRHCRQASLEKMLPRLGDTVKSQHAPGQSSFDEVFNPEVAEEERVVNGDSPSPKKAVIAKSPAPKKKAVSAKKAPATKAPKQRARDYNFEALVEICEIDMTRLTPSSRGALNNALKALKIAEGDNLTPEGIKARGEAYRATYPRITLTPSALAKHWPQLDPSKTGHRIGGQVSTDFSDWENA